MQSRSWGGGTDLRAEAVSQRPGLSEQTGKLGKVRDCLCLSKTATEEKYFFRIC